MTLGPWTKERRPAKDGIDEPSYHVMARGVEVAHVHDEADVAAIAAAPEMRAALEAANELIDVALPKFDWGASALDADAIRLLNDVPRKVKAALLKAQR